MAKHINKQRRVLRRLYRKRAERALQSKEKRKRRIAFDARRLSLAPEPADVSALLDKSRRRPYIEIEIPVKLSLYADFEKAVEIVTEIRRLATRQSKQVLLNFNNTKHIGPAALLVLLAEIYRCRRIETNAANVTGTYPTDPVFERTLQATGFFDLLAVKKRLSEKDRKFPMEYIKFKTGTQAVGEVAEDLQKALFGEATKLDEAVSQKLYRGLTEAMTNVIQHAYPRSTPYRSKLRHRWWLVGHINKLRRDLTVMLYDQGVGIPYTLPKNYSMEMINSALSMLKIMEPQDGEMIQAAMEIGRSRTKLVHRGKGLADLRGLVDRAGDGSLRILSGKGYYEYFADGREKVQNMRASLGGTLIQWRVPLSAISQLGDGTEI